MFMQQFGRATSTNNIKPTAKAVSIEDKPNGRYTEHAVVVTPEYAKQLLATSTGNRTPRRRDIKLYSDLMKSGTWINTGEPIIMSQPTADRPAGRLLDGHTRLTACIIANAPFETDIVRNVPENAFYMMNSDSRSPTDHLAILGIKNGAIAASVYNKWHAYTNKYYDFNSKPHSAILKNDMAQWLMTYEYASLDIAHKTKNIMNGACAQVAYIKILEAGCDPNRALHFFEAVVSGVGLEYGDPALTLRNALVKPDVRRMALWGSLNHRYIAMIINIFNFWIAGNKCHKVYIPASGNFVQPIIPAHARVLS